MYIRSLRSLCLILTPILLSFILMDCSMHCSSSKQTQTLQERLHGSWKSVSMSGASITHQDVVELVMTFKADGNWTQKAIMRDDQGEEIDYKKAAYTVKDNTITFHEPGDTFGSVTFSFEDDVLVITSTDDDTVIRLHKIK